MTDTIPYTMTPDRIIASVAVVAGLLSVLIGGFAMARSTGRIGNGDRRRGAITALVIGPIGFVIGAAVVFTADGGPGTGNGLAGGVVAMLMGLIGIALGWLGLARSRVTG